MKKIKMENAHTQTAAFLYQMREQSIGDTNIRKPKPYEKPQLYKKKKKEALNSQLPQEPPKYLTLDKFTSFNKGSKKKQTQNLQKTLQSK